jgi:hypothetical protein
LNRGSVRRELASSPSSQPAAIITRIFGAGSHKTKSIENAYYVGTGGSSQTAHCIGQDCRYKAAPTANEGTAASIAFPHPAEARRSRTVGAPFGLDAREVEGAHGEFSPGQMEELFAPSVEAFHGGDWRPRRRRRRGGDRHAALRRLSLAAIMAESTQAAGASIRKALARAADALKFRLGSGEAQASALLLVVD